MSPDRFVLLQADSSSTETSSSEDESSEYETDAEEVADEQPVKSDLFVPGQLLRGMVRPHLLHSVVTRLSL